MTIAGRVWKFGDNVTTDSIAPGRYFSLRSNLPELAKHTLEDCDPTFASRVTPGDIVVAGRNFGMGSSREHAPQVMKICGVSAVVAESFSRIFFRNAINIGIPVIICDTSWIEAGDELAISLEDGVLTNRTRNRSVSFPPLPPMMLRILQAGGLVDYVKVHGDLVI